MDPNTKKIYEFTGLKKWCFDLIEPLYRKVETAKHLYSSDKYLRNVDKYIFLAPSFMNYYRETSKEKDRVRKTDFVYNPLVFEEYITEEEYEKKEKRVLFVGRLVEGHKKVSRILNIWKRYEEEHPDGEWGLDIVGDGPDRVRYEDFQKNHGLRRVSFYGYQDPRPYYKRASIFLMTSAYEGWGMTFVESQQNGVVPIGMSTYLAIFDQIENRQNGVIVPPGDEDAMYREMMALMNAPETRRCMAAKGLETCKRYTVDKIVDKWEKIFEDLKTKDS
jgi:glycosyltransferase involved in cell wall biosynthesis